MKISLGISNFLEEKISRDFLERKYLIFPILLFSAISLHWSLRKAFLSLLASLCNSAFKLEYLSFSPLLFTSLLFKRLFLKLTRYPMLRYLALFYLWVNARVWAHWNRSFPMHLRYPGPHFYVLFFSSWGPLGLTVGVAAVLMAARFQIFFFLPEYPYKLALESWNCRCLWHPCLLIWQEMLHFSSALQLLSPYRRKSVLSLKVRALKMGYPICFGL